MQLKSAIAATLMLILLCGSSLASGCELLCCFSPSHPAKSLSVSCDPGAARAASADGGASAVSMAHSHCGHAMARHGDAITQHFEDASRCATSPCLRAEMLSSSLSAKNSAQIERQRIVLVTLLPVPHSPGQSCARIKRKGTRPQFSSVDPLSVALRI